MSIDAEGNAVSERQHVAVTKSAGIARLIPIPGDDGLNAGRALLVYPVLSPQQSQGLWAIPLAADGQLAGDDQRVTNQPIAQSHTAATGEDDGNGSIVTVGNDHLSLTSLSCGAP